MKDGNVLIVVRLMHHGLKRVRLCTQQLRPTKPAQTHGITATKHQLFARHAEKRGKLYLQLRGNTDRLPVS